MRRVRPTVLNVMGCRSVQLGSFEDYLVAVARGCTERGLMAVFAYPEEPAAPGSHGHRGGRRGGRSRRRHDNPQHAGRDGAVARTGTPQGDRACTRTSVDSAYVGVLARCPQRASRLRMLSRHQTSIRVSVGERAAFAVLSPLLAGVVVGAGPVKEELPRLGVAGEEGDLGAVPWNRQPRGSSSPGDQGAHATRTRDTGFGRCDRHGLTAT